LVGDERDLCTTCLSQLSWTRHAASPDNDVETRFIGRVPCQSAAALLYFHQGGVARSVVHQIKYYGNLRLARQFGHLLGSELLASGRFADVDCLVPVPLHRRRKWQRGYNQSEMIAEGIREATGIPIYNKVVSRSAFLESQTHLGRWDRNDNVEGIFQLIGDGSYIRGKHLLMVDDVVTTGATVVACGQELLKAGDVRLSVLSLGYVKH
jgi:ComF family protein